MAKNLQDLEEPIEKVLEKEFNRERLSSLTEEQINKWREWINWLVKEANALRELRDASYLKEDEKKEEWGFFGRRKARGVAEKMINIMAFTVLTMMFIVVVIVGPAVGLYCLYHWLF